MHMELVKDDDESSDGSLYPLKEKKTKKRKMKKRKREGEQMARNRQVIQNDSLFLLSNRLNFMADLGFPSLQGLNSGKKHPSASHFTT